jgi:hypothetical protein
MKMHHVLDVDVLPNGQLGAIDAYTLVTDDDGKMIRLEPPDLSGDVQLARPTRSGLKRLLDDIEEIDVDAYRDNVVDENGGVY